jgi:hypothetical protein
VLNWPKYNIVTAGIHQETPLNINFVINNEKQDCEIGTVCGGIIVGGERVNDGGKGEDI